MRSRDASYWHLALRCDHAIYVQPIPGWEQVIKHNEMESRLCNYSCMQGLPHLGRSTCAPNISVKLFHIGPIKYILNLPFFFGFCGVGSVIVLLLGKNNNKTFMTTRELRNISFLSLHRFTIITAKSLYCRAQLSESSSKYSSTEFSSWLVWDWVTYLGPQ